MNKDRELRNEEMYKNHIKWTHVLKRLRNRMATNAVEDETF